MKIACIGWGSLIWNPGDLPVAGAWNTDGPMLPVEFARESDDGRITLVLTPVAHEVRALWAWMPVVDIGQAKSRLAHREKIAAERVRSCIGFWDAGTDRSHGYSASVIAQWARAKALDGVVWTNLPHGFRNSRGIMPAYDQILKYLSALEGQKRTRAEHYIRAAPVQTDTLFRRRLIEDLGLE